jgi:hypothetical protein
MVLVVTMVVTIVMVIMVLTTVLVILIMIVVMLMMMAVALVVMGTIIFTFYICLLHNQHSNLLSPSFWLPLTTRLSYQIY